MIVGDPTVFAIESRISEAYEESGLCALGCFLLHVGGGFAGTVPGFAGATGWVVGAGLSFGCTAGCISLMRFTAAMPLAFAKDSLCA